jgi:6-phosphofructokinase 1
MGIPGTIDNDILNNSYRLRYGVKYGCRSNDKIRDTASSHNQLFFVEMWEEMHGHVLYTGDRCWCRGNSYSWEDLGLDDF